MLSDLKIGVWYGIFSLYQFTFIKLPCSLILKYFNTKLPIIIFWFNFICLTTAQPTNKVLSENVFRFQLLEIPFLFLTVVFAVLAAILLRSAEQVIDTKKISRGMLALAVGYIIMGIGHLVMQANRLLNINVFNSLFGDVGGVIAWYTALMLTWASSSLGFFWIIRSSIKAQVNQQTNILRQKNQELTRKAYRDQLTGAYNRHAFAKIAKKQGILAHQLREPLSLLVLDIDYFKQINDSYGHSVGDLVLQECVSLIKKSLRKTSFLVRIGGEEFCTLLPNTEKSEALIIAERIRTAIEEHKFTYKDDVLKITISIGVAEFDLNEQTIKKTLEKADSALYHAKVNGRNKVEVT